MIRAIIFDCFGVLYLNAVEHFYEHHVPEYDRLRPQLLELNRASDIGLLDQATFNQEVATLTGLELSFVAARIQGIHERNDKLLAYAQRLRPVYKVGLLSNIGAGAIDGFFNAAERQSLFDDVVLSSDVGVVKPSPEIYELMAVKLGVLPEECVMIDDVEVNISGAKRAGMQGIIYTSYEQTVRALSEVVEIS